MTRGFAFFAAVGVVVASAVMVVAAVWVIAAHAGKGSSDVVCTQSGSTTSCRLVNPPPGALSVSISRYEVVVVRAGPPGPTRIVFRAAQPG